MVFLSGHLEYEKNKSTAYEAWRVLAVNAWTRTKKRIKKIQNRNWVAWTLHQTRHRRKFEIMYDIYESAIGKDNSKTKYFLYWTRQVRVYFITKQHEISGSKWHIFYKKIWTAEKWFDYKELTCTSEIKLKTIHDNYTWQHWYEIWPEIQHLATELLSNNVQVVPIILKSVPLVGEKT